MAATDPRREQNFRWHNTGLTNTPQTAGEYPVEFLYREVLSKEHLLEALSFFLVRVPQREAEDDKPERLAFTLFPRYHQSRTVRKVVDFTNNARAILNAFAKYRKGTPFEPEEPDQALCLKLHSDILAAGVFTQKDAADLVRLLAKGTDAQVQFSVNALRTRFQAKLTDLEERKAFVYRLARFVQSFHFLTCFFTYAAEIEEFTTFAEYVGPQLIKEDSVSELMKQIRQTEIIKAAVEFQGEVRSGGPVKLKPGTGRKGSGPPLKKVSVQNMIAEICARFDISDEEALYIKQVTEEKAADPAIQSTVTAHRQDCIYLEGAYRGQVNGQIQTAYDERGRYEELIDPKYKDTGGIFDIMAFTVIQHHLALAA